MATSRFRANPFYRASSSQSPKFISPDQAETLARRLAAEIPPQSMGNFELVTQFGTPIGPLDDSDDRALPWPDDVMGLTSFYSAPPELIPRILKGREEFISFAVNDLFGGLDHRMYWSPYGEIEMPGAARLYFETEEKFERLMDIKGRVDPTGMFSNLMSIPVPAKLAEVYKSSEAKVCKGDSYDGVCTPSDSELNSAQT